MAVHELPADMGANMRVTINHELTQRREEPPSFLASLFTPRGTINEYVVSHRAAPEDAGRRRRPI
jgi:hypothetical protein